MRATLNEIDTRAVGITMVDIRDFDRSQDFAQFEASYVDEHAPRYVTCKVPGEDLAAVHALEAQGFQFVEFQLRLTYKIRRAFDVSSMPYRMEVVEEEADLAPLLEIARSAFTNDRFTNDPAVPEGGAGRRSEAYVRKSLAAADEVLQRLVDIRTGEVVALKTHKRLGNGEALLLLGGVSPAYRKTGVPVASEYFELNALRELGVKRITTHVSSRNYPILNFEIRGLGFRVDRGFVVLRKVY